MGNYENLKQSITEVIKTNGNQEITGAVLQSTLLTIISTVGANAAFAGIATPTTNPGTPDGSVFYLASESGTYSNFGGIELDGEVYILQNKHGYWEKILTGFANTEITDNLNLIVKSRETWLYAYGKNLFDVSRKAFGGERYYINPETGETKSAPSYNLFVSHLIPLKKGETHITLSCSRTKSFDVSQGYRFLSGQGEIVSYGSLGTVYSLTLEIPENAVLFQFSTSNEVQNIQVEYGETATDYEQYKNMLNGYVYDITGRFYGSIGKNLFDVSRKAFGGERYFIHPDTGETKSVPSYNLFVSHLIPLKKGETHITLSCSRTKSFDATQGYRFLNGQGEIVSFGSLGTVYSLTLEIPENAVLFQFGTSNLVQNIQVEYGESQTSYEPYKNPLIEKISEETFNDNFKKKETDITGRFYGSIGKNLFDVSRKAFGGERYFIHPENGETTSVPLYNLFVSHLIPLKKGETHITLSCSRTKSFDATQGYRFLNGQGEIVSFGSLGTVYSLTLEIPENGVLFQFGTSNEVQNIQVEYGENQTSYEIYKNPLIKKISEETFNDNFKKKETDITGRFYGSIGKNLFDVSRKAFGGERYFIHPETGETTSAPLYNLFVSHLIPLKKGETHITLSCSRIKSFHATQGYRFLNGQGEIVSFGSLGTVYSLTLEIPENGVLFQFSTSNEVQDIQVEYGENQTSYEPYKARATNHAKLYLPNKMYFCNNRKTALYYQNFINNSVYQNRVICIENTNLINHNNFACSGIVNSTKTAKIYQYENNERILLSEVEFNSINVSQNNGKNVNILCLGDSYTEIGNWIIALKQNLDSDGVNVNLIGAMHTRRAFPFGMDVLSENQTGGTLYGNFMNKVPGKCYIVDVQGIAEKEMPINYANYVTYSIDDVEWTVWGYKLDSYGNGKIRLYTSNSSANLPNTGQLTKTGGIGDTIIDYTNPVEVNKNPFYDVQTNNLDVSKYLQIWGFETPDIVIIQFMWNDFGNWETDANIEKFIERLNTFIQLFVDVNQNVKIIFSIEPSAPINADEYDTNGRKNTVLNFANKLYDEFRDSLLVYICPSFAFVDPINAFGTKEISISDRFPDYKTTVAADNIHPGQQGMFQIGDAITPYVHKILL